MLASIVSLVLRSFIRNLSFSLISVSSLIVGLTTAILLFLWVNYELGYNRSITDNERIYALLVHEPVEGEIITQEGTNLPLMDFLSQEVPEIEAVIRIDNSQGVLAYADKWVQKVGAHADTNFFQVHKTPMVAGNAIKPLSDNHSIAISKQLASLLFGDNTALGKTISFNRTDEFKITAVFESFPDNSSFHYLEYILPYQAKVHADDEWTNYDIKLWKTTGRELTEQKIDRKLAELLNHPNAKSQLFAIKDWRLHWNFENGKATGGRIVHVMIFSITGLFVLIMACINYMNMATARATKRTKEIGVRKMTGATQATLIRQFMMESLLITLVASFLSLWLAYGLLPFFNQLSGTPLTLSFSNPKLMIGLFSIALFAGLLAGSYPALLLSSFKPAVVLKGNLYSSMSGAGLRKALVAFQFTLSVIIVFCSLVMWQQTNFLLKKDVGYDKHQVINIWLDENMNSSFENLKNEILSHTSIESAAFSGASPMEVNGYAEGNRLASPFANPVLLYGANIDNQLLSTLKFEIVQGRNFSEDVVSDSSNFIITEKAAELFGFQNPIGEQISYNMFGPQQGEIVGVIRDFQNDDIHTPVRPVVFVFGKQEYLTNMFVRYKNDQLENALEHVKAVFEKVQPGVPVSYSFLDSDFENQFYREKLLGNLSIWITIIAITIACLGLFGLVLFDTQRRTKEIGIRKVLGASVHQMALLLCRGFIPAVLYSFLLAFPIAYYLMQKFLESYPARIDINIFTYMFVALVMLLLVLGTTLYQSMRAAMQNPVESLKTE